MHIHRSILAVASLLPTLINGHSMFTNFYVNGKSEGQGTCLRLGSDADTGFIKDITSAEMSCGVTGLPKVARTCPVQAGDVVSFKFTGSPGKNENYVMAESHDGTCAVYMKQMSSGEPAPDGSFPDGSPAGDGWFKIMYEDTDNNGRWCIDRMRDTKDGVVSVRLPSDLKPGYYLLRPELVSLHRAHKQNPQFYVGCAQVYVSGGTGTANPKTVAIPGYVDMSMPAMNYNMHSPTAGPYPGFGPDIYKPVPKVQAQATNATSSTATGTLHTISTFSTAALPTGSATAVQFSTSDDAEPTPPCSGDQARRHRRDIRVPVNKIRARQSTADKFTCPAGTIYEVGNLCLPEVPSWSDTDDAMPNCLASSKQCWATWQRCMDLTSPAVDQHSNHGCYLYQYRCRGVDKSCARKIKQGPPDIGKVITPVEETLADFGIMA